MTFPSFDLFFQAVHLGRSPFPWQRRLAEAVVEGGWPELIGVPTGLGKTACIDIAVWALAAQAQLPTSQRAAATRTWYVVDRRLLVDAAYEHGVQVAELLSEPGQLRQRRPDARAAEEEALCAVGERLRGLAALGTEGPVLHVVRLRGGAALGQRSPDPSQPALIFSTVAMYGSRLLFRGYGSSRAMRPVDAALAGTDSLILLDEAHLARPLMALSRTAAECDVGDPTALLPAPRARPRMVALTATGHPSTERFDLDDQDRRHDVIRKRLDAAKPTTLVPSTRRSLAADLARQAVELWATRPLDAGIVFCNTVATARAVFDAVTVAAKRGPIEGDIRLLTGRMRSREADIAIADVLDPVNGAPAGRDRARPHDRGLLVVATQTLEVGADLDFDFLVTESAGARALIQRFGRLNRLGTASAPRGFVCHPVDATTHPPYGDEPAVVWERMSQMADAVDMSPQAVSATVGTPSDIPARVGELMPSHLWEYAKTSEPDPDEAPTELFFSGFGDETRRVSVCWRSHIPSGDTRGDNQQLYPSLHEAEVVDLPISEIRNFLDGHAGRARPAYRLDDDGVSLQPVRADQIRPGDRIVLRADLGGYDIRGWAAAAGELVLDVAALTARVLWLTGEDARRLTGCDWPDHVRTLLDALQREEDLDEAVPTWAEAGRAAATSLNSMPGHAWLSQEEWDAYREAFVDATQTRIVEFPDGSVAVKGSDAGPASKAVQIRSDAFDDLSFEVRSIELADHLRSVGNAAQRVGAHVGFPAAVLASLERAGLYHDAGKADVRFQALLDPDGGHGAVLLAKSPLSLERGRTARGLVGWPRGGRHEALSARLVEAWLADHGEEWDSDLVLHLIATHHGHGRPLVPGPTADEAGFVTGMIEKTTVRVSAELSAQDWGQPRRFHDLCARFGYWGLALLEAVVRQSDHAASSLAGSASSVEVA